MTTQEERKEMMAIAKQLHDELQSHNTRVNIVINKLLGEVDRLKLEAIDGLHEEPKVKKIKFRAAEAELSEAPSLAARTVSAGKGSGKRACSICRQTGHRSTTCPQADKAYKAKRGK